jgi:protein phosphatase
MITNKNPHLDIEAMSHPGVTGKQNEDRYQISAYFLGPKSKTPLILAVLCDGIGGHRAGEVAAQMGVSLVTESIINGDPKKPLDVIEEAVKRASLAIYQASQFYQGRSGMGTTCAIAWIIGDRLFTANLGDSRIYLLRDDHIVQLTTDHTWVQEAYDAGLINDSERENHPNAHVIRRYLGARKTPKPDFRMWYFEGENDTDALNNQGMRLRINDILLLCSDGLTDLVGDNEIKAVIQENSLKAATDKLIQLSNERGGIDNITVVLMKAPSKGIFKKPRKRQLLVGCLFTLIFISAILTTFLFGWGWWQQRLANVGVQLPTVTETLRSEIDLFPLTETPSPSITETLITKSPTVGITPKPTITPWPTNTP